MLTARDERGKISTYTIDGSGRTTGVQTPTLVDTTFDYNPTTGLLERVKDDLNRTVREYFYDGYRRLIRDKDGLNFETLFAYDNHGNTSAVTDQLLKVWNYSNDVLGRVLTTTGPIAGMVYENEYDPYTGLLTALRDPRQVPEPRLVRTTVEWDSRGRVVRLVGGRRFAHAAGGAERVRRGRAADSLSRRQRLLVHRGLRCARPGG